MTSDLERTRASLAEEEKSARKAEINWGLQGQHHKREVSGLQQNVSDLQKQLIEQTKIKLKLETDLAQLKDQNIAMDAMLREKCTEIENNDDRTIGYVRIVRQSEFELTTPQAAERE